MKKEIKLYTWPFCPYSNGAKKLLDDRGIAYTDVDIFKNDDLRYQLQAETHHYSIPFVFIDDTCIGGFSDLKELDEKGELSTLIDEKKD
jgi:glutaredoxin 3